MWEQIARSELEFYRNSPLYLQQIESRMREIQEESLIIQHTYPDEEMEIITIIPWNLEDLVIRKIAFEQRLIKDRDRIKARCNRIVQAYSQLEPSEQIILKTIYLKGPYPVGAYEQRRTLLKFYRFILHQKIRKRNEIKQEQNKKIIEKLNHYLKGTSP